MRLDEKSQDKKRLRGPFSIRCVNGALPPPDSNNDDSIKGVLHDGDGKNVGALQTGAVARVRK